jgi:tRNA(Ile)-lysidine synthase
MNADSDEAFVKQMATTLEIPFHRQLAKIQPLEGSVEEQARVARYGFFKEVMQRHGYTKIALGHQKNDNAEAVLMHLLRGSGIRGLAGIPPVRDSVVVRPLINLDRIEIMAYLDDHHIQFVEDETNADPAYERNRIRHHLIPVIKEDYNPNIIETLHRTADVCREEDIWFDSFVKPLLDDIVARSEKDCLELHHNLLTDEPLAVRRRLVRRALGQWHGHLRRMGAHHIDAIIGLLAKEADGKRISLPNGIEAIRNGTHLCFTRRESFMSPAMAQGQEFCHIISGTDCLPLTVTIPEVGCRIVFDIEDPKQGGQWPLGDDTNAWFDIDDLTFPLKIRSFKPGDRIRPYGMQGSQKIKKLFIDRKIPASQRAKIPLLVSRGAIVWIAGIRRSSHAMVSDQTQCVLRVRVDMTSKCMTSQRKGGPENLG